MWKFFIIAGLITLLGSCGWQLRGNSLVNDNNPAPNAAFGLSLTADDLYTPLYRTFKSDYENRRIHLTGNLSGTENQPQLKLLNENTRSRILSLNTELDSAENELSYSLRYQITLPDKTPLFHRIQLFRTYLQDKNRPVANDDEKSKLIAEMRHEAAERILNQISTLVYQQKTSSQSLPTQNSDKRQ